MSINPDSSKSGKFYALTPEEFLELNRLLKDAELRVYLYLVTNHPFSDRKVETDTAIIAEHLGLARRTIQRAIRRLEELELIEIELSRFKYCQSRGKVKEKLRTTDGSPKRQMDRQNDRWIAKTTDGSPKRQMDRFELLEPLSEAVPSSPQTIQTYLDFKKTLSEDERERFFYFVKQQIKNFREPIKDLEAWLASYNAAGQNRWEVYYKMYQSSHLSKDPHQNSPSCLENSDGSKPQKRLSIREEIEQQRQKALSHYASLNESEHSQETTIKNEYDGETKSKQEENPDV